VFFFTAQTNDKTAFEELVATACSLHVKYDTRYGDEPFRTEIDWTRVDALGMAQDMNLQGQMEKRFCDEVAEAVKRRSLLMIIKAVRFHAGLGLRESKEFVEKRLPRK